MTSKQAGYKIFKVIDAKPTIVLDEPNKIKVTSLKGNIKFNNVEFNYPKKADEPIFKNMSFEIEEKKKTALGRLFLFLNCISWRVRLWKNNDYATNRTIL